MKANWNLTGKGGDFLTFTKKDKGIEITTTIKEQDINYIEKSNVGNEIHYIVKVAHTILLVSKEDYEQLLNHIMGAEK